MSYNSKYTGEQVESLLEKAGTAIQEHQDISGKQDAISDLAAIREGASKGATALQSVPSEYVTETKLSNKGYATTSSVNTALGGKVDKVSGKQLSTEDFTTLLKQKLEGLSNYDDKEIQEAVSKLRTDLDTLVSGDTTTAIKTFNEIIAFLDGVEDTETLDGIISSIEQQIAAKYTKPSTGIPKGDLAAAVQASLGKADTALQTETDPTVPSWAKAASKPTYTASEVGAVPTTRKVNGKALSTDITLSASDVSALPNTTVIPTKVSQLTNDSNFTSNTGTITGIKMNGASKGTSGVVDLGTVITAHQDISGKQDKLVSGTNIKTINGTSLLGSGDIAIESGGNIPISNETVTTKAISPNVFYVWGTMSSLTITLTTPANSNIYNEYMFQFISGSTATTLSLPSDVVILNNTTIEANKTYQVSIVKGLAVVCGFGIQAQGCCFVAGTQVTMADRTTKNIEDIKEGESVLSYNIETNENYETIVKNLIVNPSAINMARVTLEDGTSVTMNEYHPLRTQDGWKSLTNYHGYPTLTESDSLFKEDLSYVKISSIERWAEPNPVITYHLDVMDNDEVIDIDTNDNFFVNGICAHNAVTGHY